MALLEARRCASASWTRCECGLASLPFFADTSLYGCRNRFARRSLFSSDASASVSSFFSLRRSLGSTKHLGQILIDPRIYHQNPCGLRIAPWSPGVEADGDFTRRFGAVYTVERGHRQLSQIECSFDCGGTFLLRGDADVSYRFSNQPIGGAHRIDTVAFLYSQKMHPRSRQRLDLLSG